jgi:tripartite motif-containing protein 33
MNNFPAGMAGMDGRGMTTQQQAAAMQQMRNSYMNSQGGHFPPGGSSNNNQNQNGQMPSNANVMNNAAAMQRYQQIQSSRQQMLNQQMNQMRSAPQNMMGGPNMKNTSMRFPPGANPAAVAASYNQSSAQAQIAAQMQAASSGAKWHTPQQKQVSSNHNNLAMMGMSMSPPANNFINDSFKIPLRSPDTLRNNQNQGTSNTNGQSSTSFPIPLPNVTSSAPKTPSPSQKDPQKDIDSIDMVCKDSVDDLLLTIQKLDSNGVQVVPEGRKVTSPQVHSSTSDSLDPNSISLSDKNLNQSKDDPNEDWCAVCMGEFRRFLLRDLPQLKNCFLFHRWWRIDVL